MKFMTRIARNSLLYHRRHEDTYLRSN